MTSRASPDTETPKPEGWRLRARLRALYHGSSRTAVRFRFSVLIVDLLIVAFFIAAPLLKSEGRLVFYVIDSVIAAILTIDLAARAYA